MSNRKNAHRRRLRVAVLAVVCGAVFAAFFARLAWMQFARADYYADKAAEASSASYTIPSTPHGASSPTQTAWCWPGTPPCTIYTCASRPRRGPTCARL